MLQGILYADDIVLIAETMEVLLEEYYSWNSALESSPKGESDEDKGYGE